MNVFPSKTLLKITRKVNVSESCANKRAGYIERATMKVEAVKFYAIGRPDA